MVELWTRDLHSAQHHHLCYHVQFLPSEDAHVGFVCTSCLSGLHHREIRAIHVLVPLWRLGCWAHLGWQPKHPGYGPMADGTVEIPDCRRSFLSPNIRSDPLGYSDLSHGRAVPPLCRSLEVQAQIGQAVHNPQAGGVWRRYSWDCLDFRYHKGFQGLLIAPPHTAGLSVRRVHILQRWTVGLGCAVQHWCICGGRRYSRLCTRSG